MSAKPRPTTQAPNVQSHTGQVVHAGTWTRVPHASGWLATPACGRVANQIVTGHETTKPVTCKRCTASPKVLSAEDKAAHKAARAERDAEIKAANEIAAAERSAAHAARMRAFLTEAIDRLDAEGDTARAEQARAELARYV